MQAAIPRVTVPDPTEHLVTMMRDLVQARGAKFLVGVQKRESDPKIGPFLDAQNIPNTSFDEAESFGDFGYHWTPKGQVTVADALLVLFARNGVAAAPAATAARMQRRSSWSAQRPRWILKSVLKHTGSR